MELIMFVGIPASGKSTRSEQYRQQGYLVLSSDEIRESLLAQTNPEEMTGKEKTNIHSRVFEQIRKRTGKALKQGQSVVVDATNLGRKRRMNFPGTAVLPIPEGRGFAGTAADLGYVSADPFPAGSPDAAGRMRTAS